MTSLNRGSTVLSLASQGAIYVMTHLPVPSNKKESGLIGHFSIESDDGNSDIDDHEVSRNCI